MFDEDWSTRGGAPSSPQMTVITPVFNGRDYVEKCVENVISQGEFDRVEHLVLDGASTDGTVEILERLACHWPHLRVISEPDHGQSHALNKGVALARGSIIGTLNVDDFYEPSVLSHVLDFFDEVVEPGIVFGNCNIRRKDGSVWFVNRPRWLRPWQLLLGIEIVKFPLNPSAYFYHRSLHDLVGTYDEDRHFAMDLDFILRAVKKVRPRYVDENWGNFCLGEQCKTVVGGESGAAISERDAVYAQHRLELPILQRTIVSCAAVLSRSKPVDVVRFFIQHPDVARKRMGLRLRRFGRRD